MARIAFFTEHLTSAEGGYEGEMSACLINGLAENQHDVKVCTTFKDGEELPKLHPRVEVIRPFRSWSLLEVPRLLPTLLTFRPDVIHLAPSRDPRGFLHAMNFLPQALRQPFQPIVALSLFEALEPLPVGLKHLISTSDIVLVANEYQKNMVSALRESHSRQLIQVLPPPAHRRDPESVSDLWFQNLWPEFVYVPGPPEEHEQFNETAKSLVQMISTLKDVGLVFGGGWKDWPLKRRREIEDAVLNMQVQDRVVLPAHLSPREEEEVMASCSLIFVASLRLSSPYLTRVLRQSLVEERPVLLNHLQARFDAFNWSHDVNALISSSSLTEQMQLLHQALQNTEQRQAIVSNLKSEVHRSLFDAPGNLLSRLYKQLGA